MTRDVLALFEGLPSVFDSNLPRRLFNDHGSWETFFTKDSFPYDVVVHADKFGDSIKTELIYAVAGVPKEAINVKVENNTLEININNLNDGVSQEGILSKTNNEGESLHCVHKGISQRSLKKKFTLGEGVDKQKIESKLENGLLTITLPNECKKVSKPKTIDIKIK